MKVLDQTRSSQLNLLLNEICRALQLSGRQHEDAKQKYEAVADWLEREGSPLAHLQPEIFPQGSVRIKTTVRPRGREEFDVDLVLLLATTTEDAMGLYVAVRDRLTAHKVYRAILEEKKRCLRLNYAGQFHMDILPARPDYRQTGTEILVPDRELRRWSPSDPTGFARWFLDIAEGVYVKMERETEPLPEPEEADAKSSLQRTVQLLKRRRDVYFDGDEDTPRSIVLTTLAAEKYMNEETVLDALGSVLDLIWAEIELTPGIMVVPNPTRPEENFADAWDERSYSKFVAFIRDLRSEVAELESLDGMEAVGQQLEAMFGEDPTERAFKSYGDYLKREREASRLRVGSAGLSTIVVPNSRKVPDHRFYGT